MNDRKILLDEYDKEIKKDKNISLKTLITVLLSVAVSLAVIIPGIYIKNEIYYISRDISKLYGEYSVLKEENRELKRKIEAIRFKNQVLDTLNIE